MNEMNVINTTGGTYPSPNIDGHWVSTGVPNVYEYNPYWRLVPYPYPVYIAPAIQPWPVQPAPLSEDDVQRIADALIERFKDVWASLAKK